MSKSGERGRKGHAAIEWEEAFAYYVSLPPNGRTYVAVAAKFGVSPRTVERHGREERWKQREREINASVAANTNAAIVAARSEQRTNTLKLIQATLIGYADKLRLGEIRMSPADLERLYRLVVQLETELESEPPSLAPASDALPTADHVTGVIDALAETGALEALGLQLITPRTNYTNTEVD